MYPTHEMVEVLAPRGHRQALVEAVEQPGLATPDRAPQVHATTAAPCREGGMTGFKVFGSAQLGGIGIQIAAGQGLTVSDEGRRWECWHGPHSSGPSD
jgi:hypothetical protein